jgi:hypothetical protein
VESYNKENADSSDSKQSSPESFEQLAQIAQDQLKWNDAARYHIKAAEHYLSKNDHEKAASHYARAARCREQSEDWREIGELWISASTALAKSKHRDILGQPYEDFDASKHFFMGIDPKIWDNLPLNERIGRAFRYAGYHLEKAGTNQSAYTQYYLAGKAFERINDWDQAGRAFLLATISFIRQYGELNHEHIKCLENACQQGQLQDQMKYLNRTHLYYRRVAAELRTQGNEDDQETMYIKHREVSRTLALKKRKLQEWSALSLWKLTSNYGTDFWRWLIWTGILACGVFPTLYKMLNLLTPQPYTWFDSLYFSIAAFVTLSYLDFAPVGWGRVIALSETIIGLFMLGSLLTMLINKFTR